MVYRGGLVAGMAVVVAVGCGGRIADEPLVATRCEPGVTGCDPGVPSGRPTEPLQPREPDLPPAPPAPPGPTGSGAPPEPPLPLALRIFRHACALTHDHRVRCWGPNDVGQLGLGSTSAPVATPTEVPALVQVSSVMVNEGTHACASLQNGTAMCWGANDAGQVGDGSTLPRTSPVGVAGLSSVAELATGYRHTCARTTDGSVWCWGDRRMGQVGDGVISSTPQLTPVKVPGLTGVVQIAAGYGHVCARKKDGTVSCWGIGPGSGVRGASATATPTAIPGIVDAKDLGASRYHTCVARTDGTAWCWGGNDLGQLGNGSTNGGPTPGPVVGLAGVERIFVGTMTGCSLHAGGALRCWGSGAGAIDPAAPQSSVWLSPTPTILTNVRTVGLGNGASCAVTSNDVRCWGQADTGLLQGVIAPGAVAREPVVVPWN